MLSTKFTTHVLYLLHNNSLILPILSDTCFYLKSACGDIILVTHRGMYLDQRGRECFRKDVTGGGTVLSIPPTLLSSAGIGNKYEREYSQCCAVRNYFETVFL